MNKPVHINMDKVSFGYDISEKPTDDYQLHCHNYYEIYFFLEGNVDYLVEGRKYTPKPGSMLLLTPHVFHGVKIKDTQCYRCFSLHFHPDVLTMERRALLLSVFPAAEKQEKQQIYFEEADRFQLSAYFEAIKSCAVQDQKTGEQLLPIYIEALLARIITMCEKEALHANNPNSDTISQMIWYLNQHLKEPITLDQLSERFFISKYHLNKVFRKATGTTVFDYLLHKRVITAQQLLINGSTAQNAALEAGFSDYSSFYRSYTRILGHSPLQDRGVLPSLASAETYPYQAMQDLNE